jgi:hypothetical protein
MLDYQPSQLSKGEETLVKAKLEQYVPENHALMV